MRSTELLSVVPFGANVFFVGGELDLTTAPALLRATDGAVQRGGPITLEVSALEFCDVVGIRAIEQLARSMSSGCVILHGPRRVIRRLIEVLGVEMPRVHISVCTHNPFPGDDGASLLDREFSSRMRTLRENYLALAATTVRLSSETRDLLERCAAIRVALHERAA